MEESRQVSRIGKMGSAYVSAIKECYPIKDKLARGWDPDLTRPSKGLGFVW